VEYLFHRSDPAHEGASATHESSTAVQPHQPEAEQDGNAAEKAKVKSAVVTDFILSVEIVIIALGTVVEESLMLQIITVSIVALLATVGVYGIVAIIVRMDDTGYKLIKRSNDKGFLGSLGHILVKSLPVIIRVLSVVGTLALILVSGGIFVHNIEFFHHLLPNIPSIIKECLIGFIAGLIVVAVVTGGKKVVSLVKG